jgi:hypothetical protein
MRSVSVANELLIPGAIDLAHAIGAEGSHDLIRPEA